MIDAIIVSCKVYCAFGDAYSELNKHGRKWTMLFSQTMFVPPAAAVFTGTCVWDLEF